MNYFIVTVHLQGLFLTIKELIQGKFAKKACKAQCHQDMVDPYSPRQNRAETEVRKVKWLSGRWMVKMQSPKVLCDFCAELASLVRSHTAHDLYIYTNSMAKCQRLL